MTALRRLAPGTRFRCLDYTGTLLWVNECRAYVRPRDFPTRDGKHVQFTVPAREASWAPTTEVEVL